ncbi:unnamed protein product [Caenorhabditis sp. 36 PRJEB53466]|nr:unnamed protein product [Caenorhabditis sp. 36 PRJEB53466]
MMNLLLTDEIVIWLPVYELNNPAYTNFNYLLFTIVYMVLMSISAYFTVLLVVTSWRIRKFHKNMTICFSFYFGVWFECWIGVVLTWPYKCGLLVVDDSNQLFTNFELSDTSRMARITNYSESTFLLLGSFLIWHYLASTVSGMCNFVIERAIATFFFSDYEKIERSYIGYGLLLTSQFAVIQSSILLFFYIFTLKYALIITITLLSSVVISFFFLLHYNTSLRNQLDISQIKISYNLAARFQAAENARSLKLAIFVFAVICCIFVTAISMLLIVLFRLVPDESNYIVTSAFECIFSLNPLFIVPAAMFSVPEWKEAFCKHVPFMANNKLARRTTRFADAKVNHELRVSMETNLYFVQLEDSWKT